MISFVPPVKLLRINSYASFPKKALLPFLRGSRFGTGGLYTKPVAQRQAFRQAEE
jgi:hypothetical protein